MKKSKNGKALKRKKTIIKFIKHFFVAPILVCILLYGVLAVAASPFLSDFLSIGNMFLQDDESTFSKTYENIFTPSTNSGDTVDAEEVEYPSIDKQFGKIEIKSCGIDAKLFFGDSSIALRNGVGIYAGSFIPGYGKTILATGHNNTYLNGLKKIQTGDIVSIRTSYGNYQYRITGSRIASATEKRT